MRFKMNGIQVALLVASLVATSPAMALGRRTPVRHATAVALAILTATAAHAEAGRPQRPATVAIDGPKVDHFEGAGNRAAGFTKAAWDLARDLAPAETVTDVFGVDGKTYALYGTRVYELPLTRHLVHVADSQSPAPGGRVEVQGSEAARLLALYRNPAARKDW